MNKSIYKNLPFELVVHILQYCNEGVKYRNGKFIDQINKNDGRYKILYEKPKIEIRMLYDSPFNYFRNLGNYEVTLKSVYIDDLYSESSDDHNLYYQLSFYKKRQLNDLSIIILYNYIIR
jgi:hypothetical protein